MGLVAGQSSGFLRPVRFANFKKKDKDPEHLRFRPGTLDSDPGVKISKHTHVSSKATWVEIKDGLPQAG